MHESVRLARLVRRLAEQGIRHPGVLEAMGRVPRGIFVQEALVDQAYDPDAALPIGQGQTISQPWVVARMTELLEPEAAAKVLEIGTGSGYHAAVLSALFGQVFTVERLLELSREAKRRIRALGIQNVHFKVFDGGYGWSEFAPYRAILVTAAGPSVPEPLLRQLDDGGRLVMPLVQDPARPRRQVLLRLRRQGQRYHEEILGSCRFVPLVGRFGEAG